MSENSETRNSSKDKRADRDVLAELIKRAGRREEPPREAYERVFAVAEEALARKREQRRARGRRLSLALAAGVVAVVVAGALWQTVYMQDPGDLRIDRVAGIAEWRAGTESEWETLRAGTDRLPPVGELRTGSGSGLSVRLAEDISLRLSADTRVAIRPEAEVVLDGGKVYIDAGLNPRTGVRLVTEAGTATDIGTQFEVRYVDGDYRLRVREGRVNLATPEDTLSSVAGEQLQIDQSGAVARSRVASDDPEWAWAEELAPVPDFDGRRLSELLAWIERETGREVIYEEPMLELKAEQTILRGTVRNLTPLQTLDILLVTTDLRYEFADDGKILIYAKRRT